MTPVPRVVAISFFVLLGSLSQARAAVTVAGAPDPSFASLELWLNAGTFAASTTSVSVWENQSGEAGRDALQVTPAAKPTYVASNPLFANRPTVHFDGGDVLQSALASTMNITGSQGRTIFVVFSENSANNRNVVGYGSNLTGQLFDVLLYTNEFDGHFHGGGNDTIGATTQTYADNRMTVGTISYDGSTVRTYQHDASFSGSLAAVNLGLNTGNSLFQVGGGIFPNYNLFQGDIAEVLVYSERLSDADRSAVDQYLFTKYTTSALAAVPEPTTFVVWAGLGLVSLGCVALRKKYRRA